MKFYKTILFLAVYFTITNSTSAQKNCDYKIDTAKILGNQNLDNLLLEFQNDSFKITNNKKDIPHFIKKELDCLVNGFSIANPGQKYQATDVVLKKLPWRQLVFLAYNDRMLVMTYLKGGIGESRHLLMIKFKSKKIIDLWTGFCLNGMKTKKSIINDIKQNRNKKNGLHTNFIYF